MNLIPNEPKHTGSYYCTWDAQCDEAYARDPGASYIPARDAMCEDFLFGAEGLLRGFDGVRGDLIAVLDDGWDVPYGARDTRLFGSLEADPARFPSLKDLAPAERLRALSDRVKALGYRGLGLWVPTQSPSLVDGKEISRSPEEEREYWETRAKWCREAGVLYWKADWGAHRGDAAYCRMMTECARQYAPGLLIEHGLVGRPLLETEETGHVPPEGMKKYLGAVLPACDYFRTYDVVHELKYASTVDRAAVCLAAASEIEGPCAVLNVEDTALIGAALGCAVGVMRHDFEKRRKYLPLPPRPVSDTVCALRWQRLAPPFPANAGSLFISDERLTDVWHCPARAENLWPSLNEGDYYVTAPAAVSRNMPLPEVTPAGTEKPYVVCSRHPETGALCAAVTPRTLGDEIDVTPLAAIGLKGAAADAPVGLFGWFASVRIEFDAPIEGRRVVAQSLLADAAEDVTDRVVLSGSRLTVPHAVMRDLCGPFTNEGGLPALVLRLV